MFILFKKLEEKLEEVMSFGQKLKDDCPTHDSNSYSSLLTLHFLLSNIRIKGYASLYGVLVLNVANQAETAVLVAQQSTHLAFHIIVGVLVQ